MTPRPEKESVVNLFLLFFPKLAIIEINKFKCTNPSLSRNQ